jgi:1-acyl-sn-glycerol-3-phosphate acyltransferase
MLPADSVLTAVSRYVSPPAAPGFFARYFPSLRFYPALWRIIWHGARVAAAGRYSDERWISDSLATLHALEAVGCRFIVEGLEHLSADPAPAVITGNHMSALETVVLPALIRPRRPVTFIVKRSLTKAFVFRHIMCSRDPVVVDRKNVRDDLTAMLRGGEERLGRGISLVVFPQHTRSPNFDRTRFNSVGVKLAKRNNAPVIPFALKTDAWGQGGLIKDYGAINPLLTVRFRFGEPFRVKTGKEEQERLCAFIEAAYAEWKEETPA